MSTVHNFGTLLLKDFGAVTRIIVDIHSCFANCALSAGIIRSSYSESLDGT